MNEITKNRDELLFSSEMTDVFNYAMAEWGIRGAPLAI